MSSTCFEGSSSGRKSHELKRRTSEFLVEILSLLYLERAEIDGFVFIPGPVLDASRTK